MTPVATATGQSGAPVMVESPQEILFLGPGDVRVRGGAANVAWAAQVPAAQGYWQA